MARRVLPQAEFLFAVTRVISKLRQEGSLPSKAAEKAAAAAAKKAAAEAAASAAARGEPPVKADSNALNRALYVPPTAAAAPATAPAAGPRRAGKRPRSAAGSTGSRSADAEADAAVMEVAGKRAREAMARHRRRAARGGGGAAAGGGTSGGDGGGSDGGDGEGPAAFDGRPTTRYSHLGGVDEALRSVRELVEYPLTHPEIYAHLGVDPPRGILLHGPPGCGKTLLAHAIAGELGDRVSFHKVGATELVSGQSGASEKRIRDLFEQAREEAPALVFIDEIDAIAVKRESAGSTMERRMVAQLLTSMDGLTLAATGGEAVIVLAATNRPDALDGALRRSGRFDREIVMPIPDEPARRRILGTLTSRMALADHISLDAIARATPGYVGADLEALTREAAVCAVHRVFTQLFVAPTGPDAPASAATASSAAADDQSADDADDDDADDADGDDDDEDDEDEDDDESAADAALEAAEIDADADRACDDDDDDAGGDDDAVVVASPPAPSSSSSSSSAGAAAGAASAAAAALSGSPSESGAMSTSGPGAAERRRARSAAAAESMSNFSEISERLRGVERLSDAQLAHLSVSESDFRAALHKVQPSGTREGFAMVPDVTWADVGALEEVREELRLAIVEPIRRPEVYEDLGLSVPAGVLLYGPPGCGKTLVAKAIANQSHANFISVKGPELLDKYVGESERAVRQVFTRARASSPCVVFFDELDALAPRRGSGGGGSGVSERVVNQLLTELDGLDSRRDVYVVAATNRPDMIDPAMLRPGRLDKLLFVPLPDPADREAILRTHVRNTPVAPGIDIPAIARDPRLDRFSGADLAGLVREAAVAALRERLAAMDAASAATAAAALEGSADLPQTVPTSSGVLVTAAHFERALGRVRPSVSKSDQRLYLTMEKRLTQARAEPKASADASKTPSPAENGSAEKSR